MAAGGTELAVDVELEPRIANARPMKATNQTTHAPMYHRVVIRLPMAMPPGPDRVRFPYMGNESKRGITCARGKFAGEWQGRKDSNLRPSVLEVADVLKFDEREKRLATSTAHVVGRAVSCPRCRTGSPSSREPVVESDVVWQLGLVRRDGRST